MWYHSTFLDQSRSSFSLIRKSLRSWICHIFLYRRLMIGYLTLWFDYIYLRNGWRQENVKVVYLIPSSVLKFFSSVSKAKEKKRKTWVARSFSMYHKTEKFFFFMIICCGVMEVGAIKSHTTRIATSCFARELGRGIKINLENRNKIFSQLCKVG